MTIMEERSKSVNSSKYKSCHIGETQNPFRSVFMLEIMSQRKFCGKVEKFHIVTPSKCP